MSQRRTRPRAAATGAAPPLRDLAAGALLGAVTFAYAMSFAALIFAGPLAPWRPVGVAGAMVSAALACFAMARLSSAPAAIGGPDGPVVAVLGALSAGLIAAGGPPETLFSTIVAAIACAALAAAALHSLIGWRRLGAWVRFIPYPVVAGFLAASGWFLLRGAVRLTAPDWQPGPDVAIMGLTAAAAFAAATITRSALALPLTALVAWGAVLAAQATGLLAAPAAAAEQATAAALPILAAAAHAPSLALLTAAAPDILGVAGVAVLSVLLNATGIELETGEELDLDAEYRASGVASLGAALIGGLPSNLSLNRTLMARQAGGRGRAATLAAGAACALLALFGEDAASAAPIPVLAGLLFLMGAGMLHRWLVAAARRLPLSEYLLTVAIFALIVRFGYLGGAALGGAAACLTFVASYARAPFLRDRLTRREYGGFVERPAEDAKLLEAEGDRILIFRLQGYLFFGAANSLLDQIRAAVAATRGGPLAVALDFHEVTGADSSAAFSLQKLRRTLTEAGAGIYVSDLHGPAADPRRALMPDGEGVRRFPSLDEAVEAAEEDALRRLRGENSCVSRRALDWLSAALGDAGAAGALLSHLETRPARAGETLCRQGDAADEMFFVVSGRIAILVERAGSPPLRLRSMLAGTVIGEMAFYGDGRRSASVVAETDSEVLRLTCDALERLEAEDPVLAARVHRLVIRILSERLAFANREVQALR